MAKFMILYQSPVSGSEQMKNATPEQMKASMDAWIGWKEQAGEGVFEFGMPLETGKLVTKDSITDGRLPVSGYSIVQAASLEEAAGLMQTHPQLQRPGASIEVLEFLTMPGL